METESGPLLERLPSVVLHAQHPQDAIFVLALGPDLTFLDGAAGPECRFQVDASDDISSSFFRPSMLTSCFLPALFVVALQGLHRGIEVGAGVGW
ncbi:MAG: hypothetical protein ACOCZC_00470 [Halodesulfurarchaeum sp.]